MNEAKNVKNSDFFFFLRKDRHGWGLLLCGCLHRLVLLELFLLVCEWRRWFRIGCQRNDGGHGKNVRTSKSFGWRPCRYIRSFNSACLRLTGKPAVSDPSESGFQRFHLIGNSLNGLNGSFRWSPALFRSPLWWSVMLSITHLHLWSHSVPLFAVMSDLHPFSHNVHRMNLWASQRPSMDDTRTKTHTHTLETNNHA